MTWQASRWEHFRRDDRLERACHQRGGGGTLMARSLQTVVPAEMLPAAGLPRHRAIVALDIERSTSRPDPVKAELRSKVYELFDTALRSAGIHPRHRDRFIDRGDGVLALIHPVDQAPKAVLLNQAIPVLNLLLSDYNGGHRR